MRRERLRRRPVGGGRVGDRRQGKITQKNINPREGRLRVGLPLPSFVFPGNNRTTPVASRRAGERRAYLGQEAPLGEELGDVGREHDVSVASQRRGGEEGETA